MQYYDNPNCITEEEFNVKCRLDGQNISVKISTVYSKLSNVSNGFWINRDLEYTTIQNDSWMYIPASQLISIEKI